MAANVGNIHLDTRVLDKMTAEMKPKASEIVRKYGIKIMSDAAQNAPVDTSALRNSILAESKMTGDMTFTVSDGVEYGIFVEFGHTKQVRKGSQDVAGFVAAHPFIRPALEAWREKFLAAFKGLFQ